MTSGTLVAFVNVVCIHISIGRKKKHMVSEYHGSESRKCASVIQ